MNEKQRNKLEAEKRKRIAQVEEFFVEEKEILLDELGIYSDTPWKEFIEKMERSKKLILEDKPNESISVLALNTILGYFPHKAEVKIFAQSKKLYDDYVNVFGEL